MRSSTILAWAVALAVGLGCGGEQAGGGSDAGGSGGTGDSGGGDGAGGSGGTCSAAPSLHLDPGRLRFEVVEGEPDPAPGLVGVSNAGGGTLILPTTSLTCASCAGWLSIDVEEADPYRISVRPHPGALAPGVYSATLEVASEGAERSPGSVLVELVVRGRFVALTTGQPAEVVLGQADFTSGAANRGGIPGPDTIRAPWGSPAVIDGDLFLPDTGNHRVLVFDGVPEENGAPAAYAIGQPDLVRAEASCSPGGLGKPFQVSAYGGKLGAVDSANRRFLIWNSVPEACGVPADVVLGGAALDSCEQAEDCDARTLASPSGGVIAGGRVIVADAAQDRVLVWNTIPASSGAPADLVIGQPDSHTCRDGLSASGLFVPAGVWSDGERLVVVDQGNSRVLVWRTFPTVDGQPADLVLGQPDFVTMEEVGDASHFDEPVAVASNGEQIAVADAHFHRVLIWNSFPTTNGTPADVVLGREDFTTVDSTPEDAATAENLAGPSGVAFFRDALIVGDFFNNRYLIYR